MSGSGVSMGAALEATIGTGGWGNLFAGSSARIAWLLPFTTIYLGAYEYLRRSIIASKTTTA